ncbi:MAG TPA: DUF542 domain-containing protein [Terriglobia bacterium]|nr:DUF542 domain-containing protein [Terriglobia bacterium]
MDVIDRSARVGDIARTWPETMRISSQYQLDLCCGGAHSLEFVAQRHGLDLSRLPAELSESLKRNAQQPK